MKYLFYSLVGCFLAFGSVAADEAYEFTGKHLIISYLGCDYEAMTNEKVLAEKMKEAAEASGVTILNSSEHHFEPEGFTQAILLSESHACIHTYPEVQNCFVDLFTCGTSFAMEKFDAVLRQYLKPKRSDHKFLLREESTQEIAFHPLPMPEDALDHTPAF